MPDPRVAPLVIEPPAEAVGIRPAIVEPHRRPAHRQAGAVRDPRVVQTDRPARHVVPLVRASRRTACRAEVLGCSDRLEHPSEQERPKVERYPHALRDGGRQRRSEIGKRTRVVEPELERARSGAALDAKELPNAEKQLAAAKNGTQMVGIGKLYFSTGDYAKAADAIQKGIAKGATDVDDANLLLGIAYARAGRVADAQAAFAAVKAPALSDVARLWQIKLETSAAPAAAPAATG